MTANQALIESWKRQSQALLNVIGQLDQSDLDFKISNDNWNVAYHLCHIHETRYYWLSKVSGEKHEELLDLYHQVGEEWFPSTDLQQITEQLKLSEKAVSDYMENALAKGVYEVPRYDHPVLFLQHMIWHEGYHFGLLILALRFLSKEPADEWQEKNIWDLWRSPE